MQVAIFTSEVKVGLTEKMSEGSACQAGDSPAPVAGVSPQKASVAGGA